MEGKVYQFKAHGLDRVTGSLGDDPDKRVLQKLFPYVQSAWDMRSSQDVDYLIGLGRASWHPTRYKRARGKLVDLEKRVWILLGWISSPHKCLL